MACAIFRYENDMLIKFTFAIILISMFRLKFLDMIEKRRNLDYSNI